MIDPNDQHEVALFALWWDAGACESGMTQEWIGTVWNLMIALYGQPDRHYHTLFGHVHSIIMELAKYVKKHPHYLRKLFPFAYAMMMHDIHYIAGRLDNEYKSGELAANLLFGTPMEIEADTSHKIIIDTGTGHPPTNSVEHPLGALACDLDLVGLKGDYKTFLHNGDLVRKEWKQVSDAQFEAGRKAFMQLFVDRGYVYRLPYFKDLYEAEAMGNIKRYLAQ